MSISNGLVIFFAYKLIML